MRVRKIGQVAGAPLPVSAGDLARHLRLVCCPDDEIDEATLVEMQRLCAVATAAAADIMQRSVVLTRYQLTLDSFPTAIEMSYPPVVTVESLQYRDPAGVWQTLDQQDYYPDTISEPAYIVPAPGRSWPVTLHFINAVQVVYTAGYATAAAVPEPIKQWIMLAATDLHENPSRSADKPVVPQRFADALLDTYRVVVL